MIEDKVFKQICDIGVVLENAAKYNGQPAVFYGEAASDQDELWSKKVFPRIDYSIEWEADSERKTAGILFVNIWCLNKGIQPEEMVDAIKDGISNCFFSDQSGVYCTVWNRNVPFNGERKEPVTNGITMIFDIMAFPNQRTISPDPAYAIQKYLKQQFNAFIILEEDSTDEIFRATFEKPVLYVRISETNGLPDRDSYAVRWKNCTINIHLFTPDINCRNKILRLIEQKISLEGRCVLDDHSPLFIKSGKVNLNADPLKNGQITLVGEYGVLVQEPDSPTMDKIIISQEE